MTNRPHATTLRMIDRLLKSGSIRSLSDDLVAQVLKGPAVASAIKTALHAFLAVTAVRNLGCGSARRPGRRRKFRRKCDRAVIGAYSVFFAPSDSRHSASSSSSVLPVISLKASGLYSPFLSS